MLFNSVEFMIFFIVVMIAVQILKKRSYQHLFLLAASYYFYWVSSRGYVLLMLVSSIGNFYIGNAVFDRRNKKPILIMGVLFNLAMLGFFKYSNFAISIINDLTALFGHAASFRTLSIILPVGISFYTFQAMSYIFDVYYGKIRPVRSLFRFSLFVSFFPQLVAGPIVKAREFLPQLEKKVELTADNFKEGLTQALWGLVKKLAIADNIGLLVDRIFNDTTAFSSSIPFIIGIVFFSVQAYCDFAGYSDIAIGVARILGFHLPENFRRPYFSRNIAEFWRRWHMTLGNWVRDYVYTPLYIKYKDGLKGINSITVRTQIAINASIMVSLFLIGLWHGASWSFVFFGIYNGVLIVLFYQWEQVKRMIGMKSKPGLFRDIPAIVINYIVFAFSLFMFRLSDLGELRYVTGKVLHMSLENLSSDLAKLSVILSENHTAVLMGLVFFIAYIYLYFSGRDPLKSAMKSSTSVWLAYLTAVILFLLVFFPGNTGAFIYFQF